MLNLSLNHPPLVEDTFNAAYRAAITKILAEQNPSEVIGRHRWMGTPEDKDGAKRLLARRAIKPTALDQVVVTNGTQSALMMIFAHLVGQGGALAADELVYPPVQVMARRLGFALHPVKLDAEGMTPDALEDVLRRERPTAIYTTATLQNPTTAIMSLERRQQIADLARRYGAAVIEDDIYSLLPRQAPPPIAAIAPDISWYVLGVAKSIAAGLKVAYVVAPSSAAAEAAFWPGVRATFWMAAPINAAAATELMLGNGMEEIIEATRLEVERRHLVLTEAFQGLPHVTKPGSLHVWVPLSAATPRKQVVDRLAQQGIIVGASDQFVIGDMPAPNAIRLGLGNAKTEAILRPALEAITAIVLESAELA